MGSLSGWTRHSLPSGWTGLVTVLFKACALFGVGVWAIILLAPQTALPPARFQSPTSQQQDLSAVADWFGGKALRVSISVSGVLAAANGQGSALLSVNGTRPRGFRVGEVLAPGVILHGVSATHVLIDQDGRIEEVPVPNPATPQVNGFRMVPSIQDKQGDGSGRIVDTRETN